MVHFVVVSVVGVINQSCKFISNMYYQVISENVLTITIHFLFLHTWKYMFYELLDEFNAV